MTQSEPLRGDHHDQEGEDKRHHVPPAFGLRIQMQEIDHVDDNLDRAEDHDQRHRRGVIVEDPAHDQPERYRREDHGENKAGHVALEGAVAGLMTMA